MEKLNIESSGELNYHLSFLKNANMIDLDYSYGQRRYTLTALGKKTVELLKQLEGELLKQELGLHIIDELGLAFKYDTYALTNILKKEYDMHSRHIRAVYSDIEKFLIESNRVSYEKHELDNIILSVLLKNNLTEYFSKNALIGFKKNQLKKILEQCENFSEVEENIYHRILTSYNLLCEIPSNTKALIQAGVFYISDLYSWMFKTETIILDTSCITKGACLLDFYNALLHVKSFTHSLFLRRYNQTLYNIYLQQRNLKLEDFIAKNIKTLALIWDNLKYEKLAVEICLGEESELDDFTKIILRQISLNEKYHGPPLILNVKNRHVLMDLYGLLYSLILRHIPIILVNNAEKHSFVLALAHVLKESECGEITVIENSFNLLLPVLAIYSKKDRVIAEDFLKSLIPNLNELIERKREYLQKKKFLQKIQSLTRHVNAASVKLINILSILGGETATSILLEKLDLKTKYVYESVVRVLKNLKAELEESLEKKIAVCYSSSDINLYEVNHRALEYKTRELNLSPPTIESFNLLSPFSKASRSIKPRILGEKLLFEETGIPSIFSLEFGNPFPTPGSFKTLLEKLLNSNLKIISLSYDYTECGYCGYRTSYYADMCPNCLSIKPYIVHYGKIIIDYRPLERAPRPARDEYLRRVKINDVNLRKELPSI